jgi:hypothetical protein
MFCHRRFVWMSTPYVPVVLRYSGLKRSTSLPNVYLTTLAGYAVYPRTPQSTSSVAGRRRQESFLSRRTTHLLLGKHSATCRLDIRKKNHRGGFLFRIQPFATTLLADTLLLRHFYRSHSSLYGNRLSFGCFNPENATARLSRNVGKKLPSLTA